MGWSSTEEKAEEEEKRRRTRKTTRLCKRIQIPLFSGQSWRLDADVESYIISSKWTESIGTPMRWYAVSLSPSSTTTTTTKAMPGDLSSIAARQWRYQYHQWCRNHVLQPSRSHVLKIAVGVSANKAGQEDGWMAIQLGIRINPHHRLLLWCMSFGGPVMVTSETSVVGRISRQVVNPETPRHWRLSSQALHTIETISGGLANLQGSLTAWP